MPASAVELNLQDQPTKDLEVTLPSSLPLWTASGTRALDYGQRQLTSDSGKTYLINGELGRGGIGKVWLATRLSDGQEVAIKTVRNRHPQAATIVRNERQALSTLSHPAIVAFEDSGELQSGQPFFVMEYFAGQSLGQFLRGGGELTPAQALDICRQIAEGMAHAHHSGLIHNDLKPDNVMFQEVNGTFNVKLIDFGISSSLDQNDTDREHRNWYTVAYMSPEQLNQLPTIPASDVYQLGLILCLCLGGRLPFDNTIDGAIAYRQGGEILPDSLQERLGERCPQLIPILSKMLERDPAHRAYSMHRIATELANAQSTSVDQSLE